ncbi:glycosyltransferase family 9 protein [Maribacter sp. ACAM166]|nr:glycosyltransferase family 9 protein [Maribacter sp. ACAM166]
MGDIAMTVPVLVGLCEKYQNLKITVLTKPFFGTIVSGIPNVTVFEADVNGKHKGILGLWKLYRELEVLRIDMVADVHHVLRSTILKQFFRIKSIPFVQIDKGRTAKRNLVNPNRSVFIPLKSTFERYSDVFSKLGYPLGLKEMNTLSKRVMPHQLEGFARLNGTMLLGIAPFAAFKGKMYPLNLMKEVISQLNNTNKYKIVLFGGGQKEIETLTSWEQQFDNVTNMAGKLTFSDELSLISNLELMLAMDSGNAHLAAMFGIPTFTLWGVTHPFAGFYPFRQPDTNSLLADRAKYPMIPTSIYGNKLPPNYEHVMETISPDAVVKKIDALLNVSL